MNFFWKEEMFWNGTIDSTVYEILNMYILGTKQAQTTADHTI